MTLQKDKHLPKLLLLALIFSGLFSCTVLKEYEKVNINDPDMALSDKSFNKYETSYQVYREGASGANGGKSGGGCGCN